MEASAPAAPLLERLKAETRALHAQAERTGVMAELIRRRLPRAGYVALLANLRLIYGALEAAQHRLQAVLRTAGVGFPDLARAAALQQDLACFDDGRAAAAAGSAREAAAIVPAASDYARRLASCDAPALVAHLYVRCLGDLHGGQVLAPLVREQYVLGELSGGTAFYDYGDDAAVRQLRTAWREQIARYGAGGTHDDRIVAEARWAFAAHVRMFEQLQAAIAA